MELVERIREMRRRNKNEPGYIRIFLNTTLSLALLIVLTLLAKRYLQAPLEELSLLIFNSIGYSGLFLATLFVDTFIVPVTPDVLLGVVIASNANQAIGVLLMATASMIGGLIGYWFGNKLGQWPLVQKLLHRYQHKGEYLFERWGIGAIIIGGLTPVPFSTICWMAGMFKMNYRQFALATLSRFPRFILWYLLMAHVWHNA
ncbi:DedA family protein [bacterium]|nr:DedA family protein [bacterium]